MAFFTDRDVVRSVLSEDERAMLLIDTCPKCKDTTNVVKVTGGKYCLNCECMYVLTDPKI